MSATRVGTSLWEVGRKAALANYKLRSFFYTESFQPHGPRLLRLFTGGGGGLGVLPQCVSIGASIVNWQVKGWMLLPPTPPPPPPSLMSIAADDDDA